MINHHELVSDQIVITDIEAPVKHMIGQAVLGYESERTCSNFSGVNTSLVKDDNGSFSSSCESVSI